MSRAVAAVALAAALATGSAAAQVPGDPDLGAGLLALSAREQEILDELEVIETRLLVVHTEMQSLHVQERDLESHLVELDRELAAVEAELETRRAAVRDRVRALYIGSERGLLQLLFSARDPHELLVGGRYLSHALRIDEQELSVLTERRTAVEALRDEREAEYARLRERIADRQQMQAEQRELRGKRRGLLDEVRRDRRARALAAVAADGGEQAVAEATGGGGGAGGGDVAADAAEGGAGDGSGPAAPPGDAIAAATSDTAPTIGFAHQKGRLIAPLPGDVFARYGWYTVEGSRERAFRRGVHLEAAQGDPVRAVYAGQVRRAEWIRGFGNVVILDHGDRYYTVYAHLDRFDVAVGEMVTTGQVIGAAGETGSMSGPYLHFEVRHEGSPVDPLDWIELPPGVRVRD